VDQSAFALSRGESQSAELRGESCVPRRGQRAHPAAVRAAQRAELALDSRDQPAVRSRVAAGADGARVTAREVFSADRFLGSVGSIGSMGSEGLVQWVQKVRWRTR